MGKEGLKGVQSIALDDGFNVGSRKSRMTSL